MAFYLEVISPEKKIFLGQVKKLTVPSVKGQITILTHHIPLFTLLEEGKVKIVDHKDKIHSYEIGKGLIEVQKNKVILLIEPPEHARRIVQEKAKEAELKAQKIDKEKLMPKGIVSPQAAFRRSFLELKEIKIKRRKYPSPSF